MNFITQISYVFTWLNLEWDKTISIAVHSNSHLLRINFEVYYYNIFIYIYIYKTLHPYESTLRTKLYRPASSVSQTHSSFVDSNRLLWRNNSFIALLQFDASRYNYALQQYLMRCNSIYSGTAVAQWLRCCATNRKVAGSISYGVIGIFH